MSLFMTLLVRDEEDILDANIRYHLDQGVDHIIVTDNLSVDQSPEIVQTYVDAGVATYVHEPDNTYAQSRWVSRMAQMAYDAGAKWVVHTDADEFWMAPNDVPLKDWFAAQRWKNVIRAKRHDFICLEDDGAPFWQRMIFRKAKSLNPLGRPLPPKVAHRARSGLTVSQGNHRVSGFRWPRVLVSDLDILHFPLRSRAQYVQKIENGGKAYENNTELDPKVGATWRKQYAELQETGTLAFVDENTVTAAELDQLRSAGEVLEDTRLKDRLTTLLRG